MASLVQGLVKEAKGRQQQEKKGFHKNKKQQFPASHSFLVSSNWKSMEASVSKRVSPGAAENNIVAVDCEMVGVGPDGKQSVLARVSIVDYKGKVLVDEYVRPKEHVSDYRTKITGIKPFMLREAKWTHDEAIAHVKPLMEGKVVVGHSVDHDFAVLEMNHPIHLIRDTSVYRGLRLPDQLDKKPSLKKLANHHLNRNIQDGIHCSVEDARIALELYKLRRPQWERRMKSVNDSTVPDDVDMSGGANNSNEIGEAVSRDDSKSATNDAEKGQKRKAEEISKDEKGDKAMSKQEKKRAKKERQRERKRLERLEAEKAKEAERFEADKKKGEKADVGDDVAAKKQSKVEKSKLKKQDDEDEDEQENVESVDEEEVGEDDEAEVDDDVEDDVEDAEEEEEAFEGDASVSMDDVLSKSEEKSDILDLFKQLEGGRDWCFKGESKKKKKKKNKAKA